MGKTTSSILLLLCVILMTDSCRLDKSEFSKEALDKLMNKQLKVGAHKSKVMEFLEEQKITHYKYEKHDAREEAEWLKGRENPIPVLYDNEKLRDRWKDIRYGLFAIVRSSRTRFFGWDVNIWLRFYFSEDEKLIAYTLDEITESP